MESEVSCNRSVLSRKLLGVNISTDLDQFNFFLPTYDGSIPIRSKLIAIMVS